MFTDINTIIEKPHNSKNVKKANIEFYWTIKLHVRAFCPYCDREFDYINYRDLIIDPILMFPRDRKYAKYQKCHCGKTSLVEIIIPVDNEGWVLNLVYEQFKNEPKYIQRKMETSKEWVRNRLLGWGKGNEYWSTKKREIKMLCKHYKNNNDCGNCPLCDDCILDNYRIDTMVSVNKTLLYVEKILKAIAKRIERGE